jgi:MarR family transcriptional regulator, organic hydroperoxide resistance regulator
MCPPPSIAEEIRESLDRSDLAATRQRAALAELLGLADSDVLAVQHLARAGQLTASRLGELLRLSSGGATALVHRLERAGCIVRTPDPRDRRSSFLRLTREIEERAREALAPLGGDVDALVARLSADEAAVVQAFLRRVAAAAERHAEELARRATAATSDAGPAPVPGPWA